MNVFILGSGNVATHLVLCMHRLGHKIDGIYSRQIEHAAKLSIKVGSKAYDQIENIPVTSDIYIICINDNAISDLVNRMPVLNKIVVHTAGSIQMDILGKFKNHGVFYPLQTFSPNREVDLSQVPFCLEACNDEVFQQLKNLAMSISSNIVSMNSAQRLQCHLAAIFANNFVNYLYGQSKHILDEANIPFEILKPLILETAMKAAEIGPENAQTGPAKRGDTKVIEKHIELLPNGDLKKLYSFVSESIMAKNT